MDKRTKVFKRISLKQKNRRFNRRDFSSWLNSYQIKWCFVVCNKTQMVLGEDHFIDSSEISDFLYARKWRNATAYVITDKQFGRISNSWNGQKKKHQLPMQEVVTRWNKHIASIPVTSKQLKEAVYFL